MVDPISVSNILGETLNSFQKWILPVGIILVLIIILLIAKAIQKRIYEKNLQFKKED